MNDRFLLILVAKSRFGFQFRSFWLPQCRPSIGLTEKVPQRRAVRRHSCQPSIQVRGVWWEWRLGRAMWRLLGKSPVMEHPHGVWAVYEWSIYWI